MAPQRTPDLAPPWKQGFNENDGWSKPNTGNELHALSSYFWVMVYPTKLEKENRLKSDFYWDTVDGKK